LRWWEPAYRQWSSNALASGRIRSFLWKGGRRQTWPERRPSFSFGIVGKALRWHDENAAPDVAIASVNAPVSGRKSHHQQRRCRPLVGLGSTINTAKGDGGMGRANLFKASGSTRLRYKPSLKHPCRDAQPRSGPAELPVTSCCVPGCPLHPNQIEVSLRCASPRGASARVLQPGWTRNARSGEYP
jgi:hypothetical protein